MLPERQTVMPRLAGHFHPRAVKVAAQLGHRMLASLAFVRHGIQHFPTLLAQRHDLAAQPIHVVG